MGHAERNVLHAERAAALDDLLERRDHQFAAVEAEPLGAGELDVGELLEAFRLDELVEDRPLALASEADLLVRPFDALLDPALLLGIGDVHELDAQRLAVGALEDRQDLPQGAELETEDVVEEDRPVEVSIGEAVASRIELFGVLARLEAERIEIGMEMAAHPEGADQHQGAHRIAGRLLDMALGKLDALRLRLGLHLLGDRLADLVPVPVERRDEIAARQRRPVRTPPGRPFGILSDIPRIVLQALEERPPLAVHRLGIGLVARVKLVDVVGVAAVEEGRAGEGRIGVLA